MTAPHTPLVETVARKLALGTAGFEYDDLLEEQQAELCARVKPVLDACLAEEMRALLNEVSVWSHQVGEQPFDRVAPNIASAARGIARMAGRILAMLDGQS